MLVVCFLLTFFGGTESNTVSVEAESSATRNYGFALTLPNATPQSLPPKTSVPSCSLLKLTLVVSQLSGLERSREAPPQTAPQMVHASCAV